MKKIFAIITAAALFAGSVCFAEDPEADLNTFEYTEDGTITAYYGEEDVYIPAELDGTKITEIGDEVFFDLGIYTVYMEDGIEKIGKSAFEGSDAENIYVAPTVNETGERAFASCKCLAYIFFENENITFGKDAFSGCGYITFFIPCSANHDEFSKKIAAAKGDGEFGIEDMHEWDENGGTACVKCGYTESPEEDYEFSDIAEDAWYSDYVYTACYNGILNGKTKNKFDPDAGLTCGEAAKIAACINANQRGKVIVPDEKSENWYDTYVDYCYENGILDDYVKFNWDEDATRAQMAYLFSRCDVRPHFINDVPLTDIPDVHDTTPFAYEILDLYDKGIAAGSDEKYTFYPDSKIIRSEAAALVARILVRGLRIELPKG